MLRQWKREDRGGDIRAIVDYLNRLDRNEKSSELYIMLLSIEDQRVSESLFSETSPEQLFSTSPVTSPLIRKMLDLLSSFHPQRSEATSVRAALAYLERALHHPSSRDHGTHLSAAELYHLFKFFIREDREIDEILLSLSRSLSLSENRETAQLASRILDHHLDNSKKLSQIIPHTVLDPE